MVEPKAIRYPTVHLSGGSAIRRPLIVLAVCAVAAVGYVARDFLIPTAGAVVLALILTPVANTLERLRLPDSVAAAAAVLLLTLVIAGLLAVAIPSISSWAEQAPFLTLTLERKARRTAQVAGLHAGGDQSRRTGDVCRRQQSPRAADW